MTRPNREQEPESTRESVLFIVFSLVTCVLMLLSAVLLGTAV